MRLIGKLLTIFTSLVILTLIIWQIEPPKIITEISAIQILLLAVPLLILMFFTVNLCFNFWLRSIIVSVGLMLMIVLRSLDQLNLATASITLIATYLLVKSYQKPSKHKLHVRGFKPSKLQKQ